MRLNLLDIDINRHSQSYFSIMNVGSWYLFYLEWDYELRLAHFVFLGFSWRRR